ncbi:hypothetical protein F5Y04DRAFT_276273 [Hypomontagnella monticulosa]|nr:hypothetical protein F5Y04DRAFT_276273 [Hypomontagnella monticulosa]
MYGCKSSTTKEVISRLSKCELSTFHPLTLPTIVADIERNRHTDMVDDYIGKLTQRALDIGQGVQTMMPKPQSSILDSEKPKMGDSSPPKDLGCVLDWLEMCNIRNGLQSWKNELQKLVQHIPEIARIHHVMVETLADDMVPDMRKQGTRIQERLMQIINEYDGKIRDCSTVIDGMVFATQMEWNQIARADTVTNLEISGSTMEISRATQRDGSQMRSIALLTMIFLPGTFLAVSPYASLSFCYRNLT